MVKTWALNSHGHLFMEGNGICLYCMVSKMVKSLSAEYTAPH